MLATRRRFSLALALALAASASALAQNQQTQSAPKSDDNYVTSKMFQNRVFDIRNRNPQSLARVLYSLTSGFKGSTVSANEEFRTITVRDFPENIAVIEEAIRRLDTPEPARAAVEFRVHMLIASNDAAASNSYPAELSDVVKQLQSTLGYRNFGLMGSQVVRSKEGPEVVTNKGVADLRLANDTPASKNPVFYNYAIRSVSLAGAGAQTGISIDEFMMDMSVPVSVGSGQIQYQNVGFKNPVTLRQGERVVAGTTSIADKSVIVVISASTMK